MHWAWTRPCGAYRRCRRELVVLLLIGFAAGLLLPHFPRIFLHSHGEEGHVQKALDMRVILLVNDLCGWEAPAIVLTNLLSQDELICCACPTYWLRQRDRHNL